MGCLAAKMYSSLCKKKYWPISSVASPVPPTLLLLEFKYNVKTPVLNAFVKAIETSSFLKHELGDVYSFGETMVTVARTKSK